MLILLQSPWRSPEFLLSRSQDTKLWSPFVAIPSNWIELFCTDAKNDYQPQYMTSTTRLSELMNFDDLHCWQSNIRKYNGWFPILVFVPRIVRFFYPFQRTRWSLEILSVCVCVVTGSWWLQWQEYRIQVCILLSFINGGKSMKNVAQRRFEPFYAVRRNSDHILCANFAFLKNLLEISSYYG